jgi:O-methyltransferase
MSGAGRMGITNEWLRSRGIRRSTLFRIPGRLMLRRWMMLLCWSEAERELLLQSQDPVRYGTILLALEEIMKRNIPGSLAECGVYKGSLSGFMHARVPDRPLYLFDTFAGFDVRDAGGSGDDRFADATVDHVLAAVGNSRNVFIRKGYFPETASGLEDERFAFVMVDFDKYAPTKAALEFFYPRVSRGGYIFVHDFNNPESNWACSRALDEFLSDKPEMSVAIPDAWGTALFRKF